MRGSCGICVSVLKIKPTPHHTDEGKEKNPFKAHNPLLLKCQKLCRHTQCHDSVLFFCVQGTEHVPNWFKCSPTWSWCIVQLYCCVSNIQFLKYSFEIVMKTGCWCHLVIHQATKLEWLNKKLKKNPHTLFLTFHSWQYESIKLRPCPCMYMLVIKLP